MEDIIHAPFIPFYQRLLGTPVRGVGRRITREHLLIFGLIDAQDYGYGAVNNRTYTGTPLTMGEIADTLNIPIEDVSRYIEDLIYAEFIGTIKDDEDLPYYTVNDDVIKEEKTRVRKELW